MSVKGLYCVLSLLLIFRTGGSFNCNVECLGAFQLGQAPVQSCSVVEEALACHSEHECDKTFNYYKANSDFVRLNCTVATETPPPLACPNLPAVENVNLSLTLPRPSVEPPATVPSACLAPTLLAKNYRQCSLFMDSQLRAFSNYRQGLETCSIPGKWYLLRHPSLTVEVEGTNLTNLDPGAAHTRLSKINVTISPSSCDPVSRSYVAQGSLPLSAHFSPPVTGSDNSVAGSSQALQLVCDSNGTVVTLLVSWLNTAIVIRQYAGFLSVTIQVPGQIALESEGLCTGCPSQMYINITHFNDQLSLCKEAKSKAMYGCFAGGGVVNRDHLLNVTNNTYLDACLYNMYKTRTVDVLTMIHAITEDAKQINIMSMPSSSSPSQTTLKVDTPADIFSHAMALHSYPKLSVLLCCLLFLLLR